MTAPTTATTPRRARYLLFAALVAVGMGQTIVFAVLAPLGREVGLSEVQVGGIIAGSSIMFFFASPVWGRVSDRWGRRRVMLVGLFGYTAGTLVFASVFQAALAGLQQLPEPTEEQLAAMEHGTTGRNDAAGSPLGQAGYCPHCLKDYGSGHHCCDC
mgnify:CR=1 FL=1